MKKLFFLTFLLITFALHAEEITIAAEDDASPWSYADGTGYANELVRLAYKAVGIDVKFKVLPYARCKSLAEKGMQLACFTTSKTPETQVSLIFPKNPLINVHNILWVRKGDGIKSCDTKTWPRPLKVSYTNGYEYVDTFQNYVMQKIIQLNSTNSESQGLSMLNKKRVDAAIVTVDEVKTINYVLLKAKMNFDLEIGCDLGSLKGYLSFSKKHPRAQEFADKFDIGYNIIKQNGDFKKIKKDWADSQTKSYLLAYDII